MWRSLEGIASRDGCFLKINEIKTGLSVCAGSFLKTKFLKIVTKASQSKMKATKKNINAHTESNEFKGLKKYLSREAIPFNAKCGWWESHAGCKRCGHRCLTHSIHTKQNCPYYFLPLHC
jgi:hypothetical protein